MQKGYQDQEGKDRHVCLDSVHILEQLCLAVENALQPPLLGAYY
jgi:hypothetical protein